MEPFTYPLMPHARRHGPKGYASYESYRPWLRDEFSFRCVYCLLREQWFRQTSFGIDHFLAVAHHPAKVNDYDNLLYSCASCNAAKGDRFVPNPLQLLTNDSVHVREDGTMHTDNPEAARLIELLGLDSAQSTEFRMLWIGIIALAVNHDPDLHRKLMGFPDELPDLSRLRPPEGNVRPEGIEQSYFHRKQDGTLPDTY